MYEFSIGILHFTLVCPKGQDEGYVSFDCEVDLKV